MKSIRSLLYWCYIRLRRLVRGDVWVVRTIECDLIDTTVYVLHNEWLEKNSDVCFTNAEDAEAACKQMNIIK